MNGYLGFVLKYKMSSDKIVRIRMNCTFVVFKIEGMKL